MTLKSLAPYLLLLTLLAASHSHSSAQETKSLPGEFVTSAPSPEYDPKSWKEFSSKEGRFSVQLPGRPVEKVQPSDSPFGKVDIHAFTLQTFAYYTIMYIDYPQHDGIKDARAYFNGVRVGSLRATNGELLEEKDADRGGYPGRYFKARLGNGYVNRVRLYLVKNRAYLVSFVAFEKEGSPDSSKFNEQVAARFLDSFKFEAPPPIPSDRFGDPVGAKPLKTSP
jgi:hypothetical protein